MTELDINACHLLELLCLPACRLWGNNLGPDGAKALAPALAANASLADLNLSSNNLAGLTGYVKAAKVKGSSFNVGDKVMYEGREMVVSKGKDSDGDIKMIDMSGVKPLAYSLVVNASLTKLNLRVNNLGDEVKDALQNAVNRRSGFKLEL